MSKFSCSVTSAGASVDFFSDIDLMGFFKTEKYTCFVPEIVVSEEPSKSGYQVHYEDAEEARMSFSFLGNRIHVYAPWNLMRNGETLLYVGYPLMEVARQAKRSATIHAASVDLSGYGVLLLGESGAGKSTLAIKLCREHGARLFANDLAIFGKDDHGLYVSGGTKFFNFREESIKRSNPQLLQMFEEHKKEGLDSWQNKIQVDPAKIGVQVGSGIARIKAIYKVHVDDSKSELHVSNSDSLSTRLLFHENLIRYIRNTTTAILGGPNYRFLADVPSLDRPEFFVWRRDLLEEMFSERKIMYLSGPSGKMVGHILEQMNGFSK